MENYLRLLADVLENGTDRPDRTGIGSRFVSGAQLRWDLSHGFPALTTRRVPFRIAFEETMFFLRGETDTKILEAKNVNIWKGNTTREFLDNVGLAHLPEGDMGKGYGFQWRDFGGGKETYEDPVSGHIGQIDITGVDQVIDMLTAMKENPTGRRHIITAWNPQQLKETCLPPCHLMHMYTINPERQRLNSCFIMRSNDIPFGLPFNIMNYALLNNIFARYLGLTPGELVYFGWDAHIYMNQIDMCEEQLERTPTVLPVLTINKKLSTIDDILSLEYEDVELMYYDPQPDLKNKPPMAV